MVHEKDPWIEETTIQVPMRPHENSWPSIEDVVPEMVDKKSRRKSWHAIKFERKRRKGIAEDSPEGSPREARREKRPSWWNIFAAQQWPRYEHKKFISYVIKLNIWLVDKVPIYVRIFQPYIIIFSWFYLLH